MSQYYHLDDVTLWNPSQGVSGVFIAQVRLFEAQIGVDSGIGPMEADESPISLELFEEFVSALLAWRVRTNHAIVVALSDGFIATCLVLAERAGARLRWPGAPTGAEGMHDLQVGPGVGSGDRPLAEVREQAARLARFMAR